MVLFDPNSHLGGRLQRRIDSWHDNPAKSQFSVYGPLNAYLQGHKFPPGKYLVKPQAKVSEEQEEAPRTDSGTVIPSPCGATSDLGAQRTQTSTWSPQTRDTVLNPLGILKVGKFMQAARKLFIASPRSESKENQS